MFALNDISARELEQCIDEICPAIEDLSITHEGSSVGPILTLSGGVSVHQNDALVSSHCLLQEADNLLYKAKKSGKNRIFSTMSHTQQQAHDL